MRQTFEPSFVKPANAHKRSRALRKNKINSGGYISLELLLVGFRSCGDALRETTDFSRGSFSMKHALAGGFSNEALGGTHLAARRLQIPRTKLGNHRFAGGSDSRPLGAIVVTALEALTMTLDC